VKRFLAVVAGGLGLTALIRRLHRNRSAPQASPADELRAQLAEARSIADERDIDEGGETTVDAAPDPDPAARRAAVHDQARRALDELE
jgi:hypothetical protein